MMKASEAAPARQPISSPPHRRIHGTASRRGRACHHAVKPLVRLRPGEVAVDLFAGGGGASEAIRRALGLDPFVAVNHDQWAIGMHRVNHPGTKHFCEDVWEVDPRAVCAGHVVGLLHGSPDCTHFSQAKGGQHRSHAIRSLSWVLLKWAGRLHPRIITLENVKQIQQWTSLVAKRDKATGRVVTLDVLVDPVTGRKTNRVADPGERVPLQNQFLVPDKRRLGRTWRNFVRALRAMGYVVEWKLMRASDYGAGTSRERLFMCARRDGEPIRFPGPTHGAGAGLLPVVAAADCIDWSVECPSIFNRGRWRWNKAAEKFDWIDKPLADATLRRIARGIQRYVLGAAEPFIVPNNTNNAPKPVSMPVPTITTCDGRNLLLEPVVAPFVTECANGTSQRNMPADEPLRTQCAQVKGGHFAVVAPVLVQASRGEGSGRAMGAVAAFLEQANGGGPNGKPPRARGADEPVSSITGSGSQQRLVTAHLVTMRHFAHGQSATEPLGTVCSGTVHHGAVECTLADATDGQTKATTDARAQSDYDLPPDVEASALRVAAFLIRYYGEGGQWGDLREPVDTVTTRDRLALVTVTIMGRPYVIVDVGLRMLRPHELFKAQGFPLDYIIDRLADGTRLSATKQVRMVGNSVSPPPYLALLKANLDSIEDAEERMAA